MRKIKLDIGALQVESFGMGAPSLRPGTVRGQEDSEPTGGWSNCNCTMDWTCDNDCTYAACEQETSGQQTCFVVGCLGGSTAVCSGNNSCEGMTLCEQTCSPTACGEWYWTQCC